MYKLIVLSLLVFANGHAKKSQFKYDEIAKNWGALLSKNFAYGPGLLYNCRDKYWVCTRPEEMNRCWESYQNALRKNRNNYVCMPFYVFNTIEECKQYQQKMINTVQSTSFCKPSKSYLDY